MTQKFNLGSRLTKSRRGFAPRREYSPPKTAKRRIPLQEMLADARTPRSRWLWFMNGAAIVYVNGHGAAKVAMRHARVIEELVHATHYSTWDDV